MHILDVTKFLLIKSNTAVHILIQNYFKINFQKVNRYFQELMHVIFTLIYTEPVSLHLTSLGVVSFFLSFWLADWYCYFSIVLK